MLAGSMAGVAESVIVLTPGENLKTRLIEDPAGAHIYRSSSDAIRSILRANGPMSFFRGVLPVTLKQSSNAMVRFTSYDYFSSSLSMAVPVAGALAAGSWDCARKLIQHGDYPSLWTGTTPRLIRLSVGIAK